jgi:dTDP-4-amino-4,6-dideoxygalactose transaminase
VLLTGARPVFVDVREDDYNIDVEADTDFTGSRRAVIGVDLYGQMCDVAALSEQCGARALFVEDAAQAVGASAGERRAGATGVGCFSFYATKNLTTGEGGMITTSDDAVAERARLLRSQGESSRYVTEELGYNYRMTEVAAALGSVQLRKLDARNDTRRANASRLGELLAGNACIALPRQEPGRRHVWHQYTIRVLGGRDARDRLQAGLRERGIESAVFYPTPIHQQPLYRRLGYGDVDLPVAERLAGEVLSIPVHPALSAADLVSIASAIHDLTR